jgi:hypothetical protein
MPILPKLAEKQEDLTASADTKRKPDVSRMITD